MEAAGVDRLVRGLRVRLEDGIAHLELDVPGRRVNLLSSALILELERCFDALRTDPSVHGIVLCSGKPDVFCAGLDLEALAAMRNPAEASAAARLGQRVFARLEAFPKPVVAAVHGACVCGGCEMVLACHWRIFSDDPSTCIGLPEVNLGMIPGFGGTQRLPRIAGLETALELLLSGETLDARRALRAGLADELVDPELLVEVAHAAAQRLAAAGKFASRRQPRTSRLSLAGLRERTNFGRALVLRASERRVDAATGGHYPAPLAALEAVRAGLESGGRAFDREAELLGNLVTSDVAKHLVHLFQFREAARQASNDRTSSSQGVREIAIAGCGSKGARIAAQAIRHDVHVHLEDVGIEPLLGAFRDVRRALQDDVRRGRLERHELDDRMQGLYASLDGSGMEAVEIALEAGPETFTIKQQLLSGLESRVSDDCVLATHTGSSSVAALAAGLLRPGRCLGMHFVEPVQYVPLVEIVVGPATDRPAVARALAFAGQLGRTPLVVRDAPGFLVNRILGRYLNESAHLFAAGWDVEALDRLLREFGMACGPFELLDEIGVRTVDTVGRILHASLGERFRPAPLVSVLRGAGRLGRTSGRGIYRYAGRRRTDRRPDREFWRTIGSVQAAGGPRDETAALDRLILSMLDEAARCLEAGVVSSPGEIDLALCGSGFPPFRGGLLQYTDERGLPALLGRLRSLETELGPRFTPSERLVRMAARGEKFFALPEDVPILGSPTRG